MRTVNSTLCMCKFTVEDSVQYYALGMRTVNSTCINPQWRTGSNTMYWAVNSTLYMCKFTVEDSVQYYALGMRTVNSTCINPQWRTSSNTMYWE